jgi:tetratricopeptide (TPR) repeat protein
MKRIPIIIFMIIFCGGVFAEEARKEDPNKLFYVGNSMYEKRDYEKAIGEYKKILDLGLESGNLFYNIGNCYFKLGKLGHAILNYEKARRVIPQDRDLKANLDYAKSAVSGPDYSAFAKNFIVSAIKAPFKELNVNAIIISGLAFYYILIALGIFTMLNPFFTKRTLPFAIIIFLIFAVNMAALGIRYYDENILKRGIVVQKDVECKYEPIDKSTTYYRLHEGEEAIIVKVRSGWSQIKSIDGKIAWVKEGAIEEI